MVKALMDFVVLSSGLCIGFFALQGMCLQAVESQAPVSISEPAPLDEAWFMENTAAKLRQSDIILVVSLYKSILSDEGSFLYGRVVASLRGKIPVEALLKWSPANHRPEKVSSPQTVSYEGSGFCYVLASSQQVKKMEGKQDDFGDAGEVTGVYEIKRVVSYFPCIESDPGRAMQKLLRIEPARIVGEADEAKFVPQG